MKYRKRPVIIEAIELTRNFAETVIEWIPKEIIKDYNLGEFSEDPCFIEIKTLEGTMTANEGDYIIKGLVGEFYSCKANIFHLTYEKVEDL